MRVVATGFLTCEPISSKHTAYAYPLKKVQRTRDYKLKGVTPMH